jgi:hypothetical protein
MAVHSGRERSLVKAQRNYGVFIVRESVVAPRYQLMGPRLTSAASNGRLERVLTEGRSAMGIIRLRLITRQHRIEASE